MTVHSRILVSSALTEGKTLEVNAVAERIPHLGPSQRRGRGVRKTQSGRQVAARNPSDGTESTKQ